MSTDTTVHSAMLPGNPFSDDHVIDVENPGLYNDSITTYEIENKTAAEKNSVLVLDPLPHLTVWSPQSSVSSSSATQSPTQETSHPLIPWNTEDLMYLLSILLPSPVLSNTLIFSPTLASLPLHIDLYLKLPAAPAPPAAYAAHLPIGTGRPLTRLLIASSTTNCPSAAHARASLAAKLFSHTQHVADMLDRYNVLATLYASSTAMLDALQRGMIEMLGVGEDEWDERFEQLGGQVDGACVLEARVEVFLLGVGREETAEWVRTVGLAGGMEEGERGRWARVYGNAAWVLGRICGL